MSGDDADSIGTFEPHGEFDAEAASEANVTALGVDAGATLTKLAAREAGGALRFASFSSRERDRSSARKNQDLAAPKIRSIVS